MVDVIAQNIGIFTAMTKISILTMLETESHLKPFAMVWRIFCHNLSLVKTKQMKLNGSNESAATSILVAMGFRIVIMVPTRSIAIHQHYWIAHRTVTYVSRFKPKKLVCLLIEKANDGFIDCIGAQKTPDSVVPMNMRLSTSHFTATVPPTNLVFHPIKSATESRSVTSTKMKMRVNLVITSHKIFLAVFVIMVSKRQAQLLLEFYADAFVRLILTGESIFH